jgi:hypothetical protein
VAVPEVIANCHGWLLHHDAVFCAAVNMRSMVARGTGCGRNARQEYRSLSNSSSTPIRSSTLYRLAGTSPAASGMLIAPWSGSC